MTAATTYQLARLIRFLDVHGITYDVRGLSIVLDLANLPGAGSAE